MLGRSILLIKRIHTCLATVLFVLTFPVESMIRLVPLGDVEEVAVITVTFSQSAQSEERASPRKPKVDIVVRSTNSSSFDVKCFNADNIHQVRKKKSKERDGSNQTIPILSWSSSAMPHPLSITSTLFKPYW